MSATATELKQASGGAADGDVVAVPIPQPQPEVVASGAEKAAPAAGNAKRFKIGNKPKPARKLEEEESAASTDSEPASAAPAVAPRAPAASDSAPPAPKKPFFLFGLLYGVADGVLAALNRPFAWVPSGARGTIGGVAAVTLVMAVAMGVGGPLLWPRNSALDAIERRKAELRAAEEAAVAAALEAAPAKKESESKAAEKKPAGGH